MESLSNSLLLQILNLTNSLLQKVSLSNSLFYFLKKMWFHQILVIYFGGWLRHTTALAHSQEGGIQVLTSLAPSSQTVGPLLRTPCQLWRLEKSKIVEFTSEEKYAQLIFIKFICQSNKIGQLSHKELLPKGNAHTVDLHIKIACFVKKKKINIKSNWSELVSTWKSTVLILHLQ